MSNNNWPGNNGLTKEFYETCWEEKKTSLRNSITKSCQNGNLRTSQGQAVKDKYQKVIKYRIPLSWLNADGKLIFKAIA